VVHTYRDKILDALAFPVIVVLDEEVERKRLVTG
jgi:hypothetical protein